MSLPKIEYPIHVIEVPSLKKSFRFRPFLVKEEKLLLMAKESETPSDILLAIKQVINNCVLDKLDIEKIALFDLEFLFIKLRSVSVDNVVKLSYKDNQDEKNYDFDVKLDDIKVLFPEKVNNNIAISKDTGIIMKYPLASLYSDKEFLSLEQGYMFELIVRCIDKVYVGETIYSIKDYKKEEIVEFLENLNLKVFEEIQEFLVNIPKLNYVINYKNSLGNDRSIILSSLNDFFTWR